MDIINVENFLNSIKNIQEIYRVYESDKPSVYYRGQTSRNFKNISSSISRNEGLTNNEEKMYKEIIDNKPDDFEGYNTIFERLTKMQHYGLPTRLIDLTINPLIALFFAVENLENKEDGEVFVLIKKTSKVDSIEVKLNSLLAITNNYNLSNIREIYYNTYGEEISDEEVLENISNMVFVQYNSKKISNERENIQNGSFCICGNEVKGGIITDDINHIEKLEAYRCITIQYEYKQSIKKELDEKYGINYGTVYPELQSFATHLKNKYSYENINLKECYYIKKIEELDRNCINIILILKHRLDREDIEKIVIKVMNQYNIKYNKKIIVFVANNENDIVYTNWLVRANWINNKSIPFNDDDIEWDFSSSTETMRDFYNENIIENKVDLFIYINNRYSKIKFLVDKILSYKDLIEIKTINDISLEYKHFMRDEYLEFTNNCGLSIDESFNRFIEININIFSTLDDIINYKSINKVKYLEREKIKRDSLFKEWMTKLRISDEDLKKEVYMKEIEYDKFKPTIPINESGLEVFIEVQNYFVDINKLQISGNTNLYDGAELNVNIVSNEHNYNANSRCTVKNNYFKTEGFTNKGCKLKNGVYKVLITLSIPNVQKDIEFLKKAGLEYENLIGDFIIRDESISVFGKLETNIDIQ